MEELGGVVTWREAFVPGLFFQNEMLTLFQFCINVLYLEVNVIWKALRNLYCTEQELRSEPTGSPQEP